jgi:dihydroflavonol-4-reductase
MQVLIAGGTGFIGRELTRNALARGWRVNLLVRRPNSPSARSLAEAGAMLILGDVTDRRSLRAAFEVVEPDMYFHNAGWYELGITRRERRRMWAVNVEGVENALTLAAEHGVSKSVYTSSTTAFGDTGGRTVDESFEREAAPLSYYERTKAEAHRLALRHQGAGEPLVVACPAQVVGPKDHSPFGQFARLFLRGLLPPFVWGPEGSFTFTHVDDIADALVLAGEKGEPGENYFLAATVMTNRSLMRLWGEVTGRRPPFIWLPKSAALAMSALAAPLLRMMVHPPFISPEVIRSTYVSFRYTGEKAERSLGANFRSAEQAWIDTMEAKAECLGVGLKPGSVG